jgi:propionyl-CoA carboxylase alpha chain
MPSIGRLIKYRPPQEGRSAHGARVRVDSGVHEGGEIPVHYDPMIAKLVTHASDRAGAIEEMAGALDRFVIKGVRHNILFLSAIMANARWRAGELSTGFIEEEFPGGFTGTGGDHRVTRRLIGVAAGLDFFVDERKRKVGGRFLRGAVGPAKRVIKLQDAWYPVEVVSGKNGLRVSLADEPANTLEVEGRWLPLAMIWSGMINGETIDVQVEPLSVGYRLTHAGVTLEARIYSERVARLAKLIPAKTLQDSSRTLRCPMPGLVVAVSVSNGQEVKAGETVAIIEAMKMQNILRAERDGRVKKLLVAPGDSLAVDAVIAEFE